ncbi:hypothetical protein [Defluviitalea phaphyphila]|uniref:hypothetical protein n=1 Tax=Defluviitalea phaphyphila TaxID=1473580 RepID=UPI00073071F6|nr:hypothetical protein [Defluviitalea phaphyphila]
MNIPFFLSIFIIFIIFYNIKIRKAEKEIKNSRETFLKKEREAMFVRKKTLENLDYISISLHDLPMLKKEELTSNKLKQAYEQQQLAITLSSKPLLNLNGISNTDLKYKYGSANLEILINYEQNYQRLIRALLNWGQYLYEAGKVKEAVQILEKSISIGSDLSQNYILLADIYNKNSQKSKLLKLKELAEKNQKRNVILKKVINHIDNILNS